MKIKITKHQANLILNNIPPASSIKMSGKDAMKIIDTSQKKDKQ